MPTARTQCRVLAHSIASLAAFVVPVIAWGAQISGDLRKWHALTIDFAGPPLTELGVDPNPFLDFRLDVVFTAPSGVVYRVPGYFDGDGSGGGDGSVWRVRFTPDEAGPWSYQASFRVGPQIAVDLDPVAGTSAYFDAEVGTFSVEDLDPNAQGFLRFGRLESVGQYYFKFRDGGYWVKTGVNSPENLLGYSGFDNTPHAWHSYLGHIFDWQLGDPDWYSPNSAGVGVGQGIIGALNYLASQGVNSIYFMPNNIGADGMDTWPYASPTINRAGSWANDNLHFDISKLRQWEVTLAHAQRKGLFLHFVLSDRDGPNRRELDDATLGVERKLFYRELIARFAHHNALQWNIAEEYNLGLPLDPTAVRSFGEYIFAVDAYDHPITVHSNGNTYATALAPFLSDPWFRVISLQTWQQPESIDGAIEHFRLETANVGNPIPVMADESIGVDQVLPNEYRKRVIWDALLSGGGHELLMVYQDSSLEDFRPYEEQFRYLRIAREFVEANLPFWEMAPADSIVRGENKLHGGAEVFAKADAVYAVYLPSASPLPDVKLSSPRLFEWRWFNPRSGAFEGSPTTVTGAAPFRLTPPPADAEEDWVVLISAVTPPPVAEDEAASVP